MKNILLIVTSITLTACSAIELEDFNDPNGAHDRMIARGSNKYKEAFEKDPGGRCIIFNDHSYIGKKDLIEFADSENAYYQTMRKDNHIVVIDKEMKDLVNISTEEPAAYCSENIVVEARENGSIYGGTLSDTPETCFSWERYNKQPAVFVSGDLIESCKDRSKKLND